ncbi:unnamed protein product [Bemisia tabaci]|uniref:Dynactin subunit 2 n=1 Tax=Bemisia tabaci TaxID=7038 RepID=A0A9P0F052_BEMTA|nr:unnamed protein product [Bemisia tabaci]
MADPKYAGLPGIAFDEPDVYETTHLPEADQNQEESEEESDVVERLHIDAKSAFAKFNSSILDGSDVDFSDNVSRKRRTGYNVRSGDWELAGPGEKETITQKFRRLQLELNELSEEIAAIKEASDDKSIRDYSSLSEQVERMLKHLSCTQLEDVLGTEICAKLTDPQGAQLKKLLEQLDEFIVVTPNESGEKPAQKTAAPSSAANENDKLVRYELMLRPSQSHLHQTQRFAQLEQKLSLLENLVGNDSSKLARLGGKKSLGEVARSLNARVSMLDMTKLEAIELRLTALFRKLEQINEKAADVSRSEDTEREAKLQELYEFVKKSESVAQVLPQALNRMAALETIHQKGGDFLTTVSQIETMQSELTSSVALNEQLLKTLTENLNENMASVKTNMTSFDSRIKALQAKN